MVFSRVFKRKMDAKKELTVLFIYLFMYKIHFIFTIFI